MKNYNRDFWCGHFEFQKTSLTLDTIVVRLKAFTSEKTYPKIFKRPESRMASMEAEVDRLPDQMA